MKLISLPDLLTKLFDVAPEVAHVIDLYAKAKRKNSPDGKRLSDEEKADLTAALQELIDDLKD